MPDSQSNATVQQLKGLEYRSIGPFRGGRVVAVAGHPTDDKTFYFGACAGGVWKTVDAGNYWENITDPYFKTGAVGALAVSDSDPNTIFAGTGEHTIRGDVSHGDGVYKSTDGGKTWRNIGLKDTRHISKIRIHPANPDLVYVAALGHAFGPNEDRGVYRSKDGGETWEKVLFKSVRAGAIDLSMDPNNPRVLFASLWQGQRGPHFMHSGGPDSGLYRSTDGGDSWEDISHNSGLPRGILGKIGVAVSPAQDNRVWALVEAEDGALFRSDNGGNTWQRINENADLRRRAWYYHHIFADPQNADTVWVLNLQAWKSIDGGANFTSIPTPHGDNHDLWIDRKNTQRMIEGNDGGACVTFNGGYSWSTLYNQPTAQFYHVAADTQYPYRLYGSQQDNTSMSIPSMSVRGQITAAEQYVPGGGESGYIAIRPDNPNIVFAGAIGSGPGNGRLTRYDHATGQSRIVTVWPDVNVMYEGAESLKYRFQWTFPIFLSPHDPNVLYVASNKLLRSTNEGQSWEEVSPDLTRAEPETLKPSGGPLTRDNTGAEIYGTIFAAVESPHEQGTFWVGSDDGLVHLSRDNGQTWQNITPPDLPEWSLISIIEVSPHDPATAYLAATRYKLDDPRPYLFKTTDYGQTWTQITTGIPADDFTRVIREDPQCQGLLYAGTETGIYLSFDDGTHWQAFETNLPATPIHDLIIKDHDLLVATHGRSFWILDDVTPLHQIKNQALGEQVRLFKPEDTIRFKVYEGFGERETGNVAYSRSGPISYSYKTVEKANGETETKYLDAGKNRPSGVIISYFLPQKPQGDITLTILDGNGKEVRTFSSKKDDAAGLSEAEKTEALEEQAEGDVVLVDPLADAEEQEKVLPTALGVNRFVWNFRAATGAKVADDKQSEGGPPGPTMPPGTYHIRLAVDGQSDEQEVQVLKDPRISASQEDLQKQYDLASLIHEKLCEVNTAINQVRDLKEQLSGWERRLKRSQSADQARQELKNLHGKISCIEDELINSKATGRNPWPPPNIPTRLNHKLSTLFGMVESADFPPTQQEYDVFNDLKARVNKELDALQTVMSTDVPSFNQQVRDLGVQPLVPHSK